ncbi:MAG: histidine phosphatase family protein [Aquabacterium sp.]|jgi:probable phosphoglycerate mutase|nr:MAG: histidine phosphatase family protein [Aquabacterium sp.]
MHDQLTRVFALRHAETAWNVDARIQGQLDVPLNERGHWQAARLAEALADEDIAAIYSSDLQRAHATASRVGERLGLPVVTDPRLRERHFGCFQGLTHGEIAERWPEHSRRWREREPGFGPEGGETLEVFHDRCVEAARALASRWPGRSVVLMAHGGVLDCLYRAAMGLDISAPRTWTIGNASINRLLHTPQGLTMLNWADTRHLEEAQEPVRDEHADGGTVWDVVLKPAGGTA